MEEIAEVYARSLFEVADEQDKLDPIHEQLGQFADALAADPKLADDRQAQHRYNAACAAALAAAEKVTPTVPPRNNGDDPG